MARILLIEDDPRSVKLVKLILSSQEYQVDVAENGLEGLKMARENTPDLTLLDLMLPGVDGFEVLNQIRGDPQLADLPVVVVSAKTQPEDKAMADKLGVNAYLTKPFRKAELLELIRANLPESKEEEAEKGRGFCVALLGAQAGASSLISLLGQTLAASGAKTAIVDLRPFSVEHAPSLDMPPRSEPLSLADPETVERLPELTERHSSGLRLLNNLEGGGEAGQLTPGEVERTLSVLLAENDYVLVEVPLYQTDVLRRAGRECALMLLIAQSDRASLAAARSALTRVEQAGIDEARVGVVLTGAAPEERAPDLGYPVMATIPTETDPGHPSLQALVERLQEIRSS